MLGDNVAKYTGADLFPYERQPIGKYFEVITPDTHRAKLSVGQ